MKQLSSIDLHFAVSELAVLAGAKIDSIYNAGHEEFYFQFHKTNVGKLLVRIIVGKALFLSDTKHNDDTPSGLCRQLRKHLEGMFVEAITQLTPERIVLLVLKNKETTKKLYLEFFSVGNIVLCDEKDTIVAAHTSLKVKDRIIAPQQQYTYPKSAVNIFEMTLPEFRNIIAATQKNKMVTCLAIECSLGGVYSEEVCKQSEIEKNTEPKKLSDTGIKNLYAAIQKLRSQKSAAVVYQKNNQIIDCTPFPLSVYADVPQTSFTTFCSALSYYSAHVQTVKKTAYDTRIEKLQHVIAEQEAALVALHTQEAEYTHKAELIYHHYKLISEIIDEINKATQKYSWAEIKEKLKDHPIIKEINLKDKAIVMDV